MVRKTKVSDALIKKYADKQNSIKAQRNLTKELTNDLKALESELISVYNVPDNEITTLESAEYIIKINRVKKRKQLTSKQIVELINEQMKDDKRAQSILKEIEMGNGDRESLSVAVKANTTK